MNRVDREGSEDMIGRVDGSPDEAAASSNDSFFDDDAVNRLVARSVRTPKRKDARFVSESGSLGSQRYTRFIFNEAVASSASVTAREDEPICKGTSIRITERVRHILYDVLEIPKGALTYTKIKKDYDIQGIRKSLEKYFPVLTLAENQWAADGYIQEVARRDKAYTRRRTVTEPSDGSDGINEGSVANTNKEDDTGAQTETTLPHTRRASQPSAHSGAAPRRQGGIVKSRKGKRYQFRERNHAHDTLV